jgi:hypothetical protein
MHGLLPVTGKFYIVISIFDFMWLSVCLHRPIM